MQYTHTHTVQTYCTHFTYYTRMHYTHTLYTHITHISLIKHECITHTQYTHITHLSHITHIRYTHALRWDVPCCSQFVVRNIGHSQSKLTTIAPVVVKFTKLVDYQLSTLVVNYKSNPLLTTKRLTINCLHL